MHRLTTVKRQSQLYILNERYLTDVEHHRTDEKRERRRTPVDTCSTSITMEMFTLRYLDTLSFHSIEWTAMFRSPAIDTTLSDTRERERERGTKIRLSYINKTKYGQGEERKKNQRRDKNVLIVLSIDTCSRSIDRDVRQREGKKPTTTTTTATAKK